MILFKIVHSDHFCLIVVLGALYTMSTLLCPAFPEINFALSAGYALLLLFIKKETLDLNPNNTSQSSNPNTGLASSNYQNFFAVVVCTFTAIPFCAMIFGVDFGSFAGCILFVLFVIWKPLNLHQVNTSDPSHDISGYVRLDDLIIELEAVTNWFVLGLHLGVTPCKLKLLKNKKMSVEYKRNRMLVEWINNHHKPTWSTVVHALEGMNELQLAGHITVKYGVTNREQNIFKTTMETPDLSQLNIELINLVHWFSLGLLLGIPVAQLKAIEQRNRNVDDCKNDMLMTWISSTEPRWYSIVNALEEMKHYDPLAKRLAQKYLVSQTCKSCERHTIYPTDCLLLFYCVLFFCSLILNALDYYFFGNGSAVISVASTLAQFSALFGRIAVVVTTVILLVLFSLLVIRLFEYMQSALQSDMWDKRDEVTFKDLMNSLKDMTEWWLFGKAVGIPEAQLLIIERDEKTTERCKIAIVQKWIKLDNPSWNKVVYSLFKCGMTTLGWEIAAKHGISVTTHMIANSKKVFKNPNFTVEDSSSNDGFQEAAVSLCPTGLLSVDGVKEVSVKDLLSELEEVTTSWFVLGVFLNIPESKLCEIRQDCDNDEECKMEMIILWRTLCIPTWNAVADALAKIGMHSLAIKLARKYDIPLPTSSRHVVEQLKSERGHSLDQAHIPEKSANFKSEVKEILESKPQGGVDLSEMLSELKEVIIEWFMLGIYLDITPEILKIIQAEWETEEHRQLNMLIKWSDKEEPTWEKLIHALIMIKKYNVATNIAIKYQIPLPQCQIQKLKESSHVSNETLRILEVVQAETRKCTKKSMPYKLKEEPRLQELIKELKDVIDWFCLGVFLSVSPSKLKAIQKNFGMEGPERCKIEMLIFWRDQKARNWAELVQALTKMGMERLAKKIATNHNVSFHEVMVSSSAEDVESDDQQEELKNEKEKHLKEIKEVKELHAIDLEKKEHDLHHQEEQLKEAEKALMEKGKELQEVYGKLQELDQQLDVVGRAGFKRLA